ncbi:nucleotidyltransferase family protein [Thermococcus sp. M39]|uniref:nucleotidyltransferase family protein n=1 Tax=Thermococcus sp. M39 TaxID=1638262 RepID=UPI0014392B16|nr:nucleotidyltransferase family protein [Thermococcus sp. M39]NJE06989.1 nucleotidyltransferase family protein [Thermococcus sp. M39]
MGDESMKKIKVGVIPAAGKGNRISELPLTRILPKPMLPILNRPILEYVIENMKKVGVETVYMIVGHKKELIKEYFRDGSEWNVDISYIEQKELKGIAHAVGLTREYIDEPFMVILGDDLTITDSFNNFVEIFWKTGAYVVEGVVSENSLEVLKRTCYVLLDNNNKIIEIVEKPTQPKSNLRGIGVYLFDPIVFEYIDRTPISAKRGEKEITDTIGLMAKDGKAYGAIINGVNININTLDDLMSAIRILLKIDTESDIL